MGICAPYKAQVKLLKNLTAGFNSNIRPKVGTVHTFQGDERDVVIFDSVESYGSKKMPGLSLNQIEADKSNLLTVAVSRAKECIIIIANLRYLDAKLPGEAFFRYILHKAQSDGKVIDVNKFIDAEEVSFYYSSIFEKVNSVELGLDISELKNALVREDQFFTLLGADLINAKKVIVFYSGFYGPNRLEFLFPKLKQLIDRGVEIRCVIPPTHANGSLDQEMGKQLIGKMRSIGIAIDFRKNIHQKAVLIDDDIVWFGSLNPLSFSGRTEETMLRLQQKNLPFVFAENFSTNPKAVRISTTAALAKLENPICNDIKCGDLTIYDKSRFGTFYTCVNADCGKKQN